MKWVGPNTTIIGQKILGSHSRVYSITDSWIRSSQSNGTTLPNGIKVVVDSHPTPFAAGMLLVGTGPRNDTDTSALHLIQNRMTERTRIDKICGHLEHKSATEYAVVSSLFDSTEGLVPFFKSLKRAMFMPSISKQEIETVNEAFISRAAKLEANPRELVRELGQMAMLGDLSLQHLLEPSPLDLSTFARFQHRLLNPQNLVLAASRVDLERLTTIGQKVFGDVPLDARPSTTPNNYRGRVLCLNRSRGSSDHTHFFLGFPCPPEWHRDVFGWTVLSALVGGGSSFSAGGPGKGLYSRFYRNVLMKQYFVESLYTLGTHSRNAGCFGIVGSCDPGFLEQTLVCIIKEFGKLGTIGTAEFERAKNIARSSLLMGLESAFARLETWTRNTWVLDTFGSVEELARELDRVQVQDVVSLGTELVLNPSLTLIAIGDKIPGPDTLAELVRSAR